MNKRILQNVADGLFEPQILDEPFTIIAESCTSPYIPHEACFVYFFSYGNSLVGNTVKEISISESTARKLIELYHMSCEVETSDRLIFHPINSSQQLKN